MPDHRPARVATEGTGDRGHHQGAVGDSGRRANQDGLACRHAASAPGRWATLMRHFLRRQGLAQPVGGLARRVPPAPPARLLEALPRLPQAPSPGGPPARSSAVAMPPITPGAHVHRLATQVAQEAPAVGMQGQTSRAWTPAPKPAMIALLGASAPGRERRTGSCPDASVLRVSPLARFSPDSLTLPRPPPRATMMLPHLKGFARSTARCPRFLTAAHTGAWIETGREVRNETDTYVAPRAGAWIETRRCSSAASLPGTSPPARGRGLKP